MKQKLALSLFLLLLSPFAFAVESKMTEKFASEASGVFFSEVLTAGGIDWKVGEWTEHEITLGLGGEGKVLKYVSEDLGDTLWLTTNMDISFFGQQQRVETKAKIRRADGKILEFYVNGKKQEAPSPEVKVISQEADRITVPAGTFECIHVKLEVTENGQTSQVDMWVNPRDVALEGTVKMNTNAGTWTEMTMLLKAQGEKNPPVH